MIVLMDTHSFLGFVNGSSQLSPRARAIIEDPANDNYFSVLKYTFRKGLYPFLLTCWGTTPAEQNVKFVFEN